MLLAGYGYFIKRRENLNWTIRAQLFFHRCTCENGQRDGPQSSFTGSLIVLYGFYLKTRCRIVCARAQALFLWRLPGRALGIRRKWTSSAKPVPTVSTSRPHAQFFIGIQAIKLRRVKRFSEGGSVGCFLVYAHVSISRAGQCQQIVTVSWQSWGCTLEATISESVSEQRLKCQTSQ